ncbi:MAG: pyridoxal-phosphate dependent enzyme [Vicingaceae bacterium]
MSILQDFPFSSIDKAHEAIKPFIHRTPILSSSNIDKLCGCRIYFKCENFQKVGAFKMRGAAHAVSQLKASGFNGSVVTHSSGNHAQALAKAAKSLGIKAYIVMPETAPRVKVEAVKAYGGEITFCAPTLDARESEMKKIQAKTGATFVPPYDDRNVILGQATAAKELLEEKPELEAILAPVGGGGLLAGTALTTKHLNNKIKAYGAEPEGADDAYQSFKAGKLILQTKPNTLADGLLTSLGKLNFEVIKELVDGIFLVNDKEIIASMQLIWGHMKIIVEPSCAVPLAAVLKQKKRFEGKKIGVILSGGNVDLDDYFNTLKQKAKS